MRGRAGAAAFRELARRRLSTFWEHYTPVDHRTPEERRRENEDLLRKLPGMLKPEVFRRVLELVGVDDYWDPLLKAGLDREAYLDVIEAIVTIQHDAKALGR